MASAHAVRRVDVALPVAWATVADHQVMATWGPGVTVTMERLGDDDPNGVGAIRDINMPGPAPHIREEITEFEPGKRLAYRALSGPPFKDWCGVVEVAEHQGGTAIKWSLSCRSAVPGTDLILRAVANTLISAMARSIRKRA
ncbi:MAG TPA: SRPBCC family protein [Pseudonocardiaceae bacterium]|jgi:hypothetical protein|nr:SRPBCC family protein [Pseudonocardiaceae bacterium]